MTFLKYGEILFRYLAINTISDWSKESNEISASQMMKEKAQGIQSQKLTFSVGNIYWACYDSSWGWKRPSWSLLFNFISFYSPLQMANNSLFHFSTTTSPIHQAEQLALLLFLLCVFPYILTICLPIRDHMLSLISWSNYHIIWVQHILVHPGDLENFSPNNSFIFPLMMKWLIS